MARNPSKKPRKNFFNSTFGERDKWELQADEEGMDFSEWVRFRLNTREGISQEAQLLTRILAQLELQNRSLLTWIMNQGIEIEP